MAKEFRDITLLVKDLEKDVASAMRGLVLEITANLRRAPDEGGTPVDTGWARANWISEVGKSHDEVAGTRPEGPDENPDEGPLNAGLARVLTYRVPRERIYITNNVPYIVICNETHRPGFVQRSISEALVALERGLFR
jgi:hypothetical protein